MDNSKTIDALNNLLQITNDRIKGFEMVEKKVIGTNNDLKVQYEMAVTAAYGMRSELSSLIRGKGGDENNTSTVAGGLHRTWIEVKNSLLGDREESTLENVTFGEKASIEAYEKALESGDLDENSTTEVKYQLEKIRESYLQFSSLEKSED